MKAISAALLTWCLAGAVKAEVPKADVYRMWTDLQGRKVEARFRGIANDTITLQTKDGRNYSLLLVRLSAEDQAIARSMSLAVTQSAADPTAASQWSPPARPRPTAMVKGGAKAEAKSLVKEFTRESPLTIESVETFAVARALYREGLFEQCQQELTAFWKKNPRDAPVWALRGGDKVGFKLGGSCGYPSLLLLTDAVAWRIKEKTLAKPVQAVDWNIVVLLVGKSSGLMPANDAEAKEGKGVPVSAKIDPLLLADNSRAMHDLVWLTREYYRAVTQGKINLRLRAVHLPDLEFKACAPGGPGGRPNNITNLKAAVPHEIAREADWYWLVYPEIEPPPGGKYYLHTYDTGSTTPGGITNMPGTRQTLFFCEDHWLTRRAIEDGRGPIHPLAHQIYIPYWLQHEFFHDHFRQYPQLELEATGHQWFDRAKWPSDFVGRFESDYYYEAMFKRLQNQANPSFAGSFIRRNWFPDLLPALKPEDLLGRYAIEGSKDGWTAGEIKLVDGGLMWRNDAGRAWALTLEKDGLLKTDESNPYFKETPIYEIFPVRGADGLPAPGLGGFQSGKKIFLRQK